MLVNYYQKIRALIQDSLVDGYYANEFISSYTFTLPDSSVQNDSTLVVSISQNIISDSNYSFDTNTSKLTISLTSGNTLTPGNLVEVNYKAYKKYTDNEIRQYILSAIIRLSTERYCTFILRSDDTIFPTPVEPDENLICLIASILMEGNVASYKTSEVAITFGRDEDMESRIKRSIRQFKKTYGDLRYMNFNRQYDLYPED
jgi:hypothetical protein